MKKNLLVPVLASLVISLNAQTKETITLPDSLKPKKSADQLPAMDVYGAIPLHQKGWGAGMGVFTPSIRFGNMFRPIHLRFGGEFYVMELNRRAIGDVPLSAPQTGDAKVRLSQNIMGFNLVARFSAPYSERITQYVDLFSGATNYWTGMRITPYQQQEGYEESSSLSLANSWQFSYGASAGVLWGLSKNIKLNTGLMYTRSFETGEVVDISKANIVSGSIVTENVTTPKSLWVLKVGFTFIIPEDNSKKQKRCYCDCDHTDSSTKNNTWNDTRSTGNSNTGGRSNGVNINVRPSK